MADLPFLHPAPHTPSSPTNNQIIHSPLGAKGMRCGGMDEVKYPPRFPVLSSPTEKNLPVNLFPVIPSLGDKIGFFGVGHFDYSLYDQINIFQFTSTLGLLVIMTSIIWEAVSY